MDKQLMQTGPALGIGHIGHSLGHHPLGGASGQAKNILRGKKKEPADIIIFRRL